MAVRVSEFIGATATLDCLSVLQTLRGGMKRATHHGNKGAKLWNMLFPYLDDARADDAVRWMPAHKGSHEAAQLRDSRGDPLTKEDVEVNALVDAMAKSVVEEHRVPLNVRRAVAQREAEVMMVAFSIGLAAREANEGEGEGGRDAATFTMVRRGQRQGKDAYQGGRGARSQRVVQLGGHCLSKVDGGWACLVCRRTSKKWDRVASEKCTGNRALRWAQRARSLVVAGAGGGTDGAGHVRFLSDEMIWCDRCGATATHHAVSLMMPCRGKPRPGGAEHNLRLLRKGINPTTRRAFRDGPHPEPGRSGRPSGFLGSEAWGSGGAGVQGIAGESAKSDKKDAQKGPTAKERMEALRRRVVDKEKGRRDSVRDGKEWGNCVVGGGGGVGDMRGYEGDDGHAASVSVAFERRQALEGRSLSGHPKEGVAGRVHGGAGIEEAAMDGGTAKRPRSSAGSPPVQGDGYDRREGCLDEDVQGTSGWEGKRSGAVMRGESEDADIGSQTHGAGTATADKCAAAGGLCGEVENSGGLGEEGKRVKRSRGGKTAGASTEGEHESCGLQGGERKVRRRGCESGGHEWKKRAETRGEPGGGAQSIGSRKRGREVADGRSDGDEWCDRCGGTHWPWACPHFSHEKDSHADAWLGYRMGIGTAASNAAAPAKEWEVQEVEKMPGDGSCLFHALAYGRHGQTSEAMAKQVRRKIVAAMLKNPQLEVAGASIEDWVRRDSGLSVAQYAARLAGGAWGGASSWLSSRRLKGSGYVFSSRLRRMGRCGWWPRSVV